MSAVSAAEPQPHTASATEAFPWPKCQYWAYCEKDDDDSDSGAYCEKDAASAAAPIVLCFDHLEQAAALLFEAALLTDYGREVLRRAQAAGEKSALAIAAAQAIEDQDAPQDTGTGQ